MKLIVTAVIFIVLWVLTFIPAWYFAVKIAITIKSKPIKLSKLIFLFVVYEIIILLPYISILWGVSGKAELISALVIAFVILICVIETVRITDIDKLKYLLWTTYSYCYDSLLHFYPYKELLNIIYDRVQEYTVQGSTIADIGSGTGNLSYKILGGVDKVTLIDVEPNVQMLRRSRKKLNRIKSESEVSFINKNAVNFLESIPDKSLDVVVMCNVLYAVNDREYFWKLLSKKIGTDGLAVISNSDRGGSSWLIKYHLQHSSLLQLLRPKLIAVGVIDGFINQLSEGDFFGFTSKSDLEYEMSKAKLKMIDVERCYGGKKNGVNLIFTVRNSIS